MRVSPFYLNFAALKKANDKAMMKDIVMSEIADLIVSKRSSVIDILNESGVSTDTSLSSNELASRVMDNLYNKELMRKLSVVIAEQNKDDFSSFCGTKKGKRVTGRHFVNEITMAVSGSIESGDKDTLIEKTNELDKTEGTVTINKKTNIVKAGAAVSTALLLIYVVAFQPQWIGLGSEE